MENISGFGSIIHLQASNTFPVGFPLTQFADDADPFDIPSVQIADSAMGVNGDMVVWSKANPIKITLNLIPTSLDDEYMSLLANANRVGRGKIGARDIITLTCIYPNNRFITLSEGFITDAMFGQSIASEGRLKSKSYQLAFEKLIVV